MANKQSVPVTNLLGANAKKEVNGVAMAQGDKQVLPDDEDLIAAGVATDVTNQMLKFKQKTDEQSARLNAAATLQIYRQQLGEMQNQEAFDNLFKEQETLLKNGIGVSKNERDFWRDNGAKIMELNRRDVENLRREKMTEFGKNSLLQMLADNQNMLAVQPMNEGNNLLKTGVEEIANSPFLTDTEKEQYRNDYLKTGILNLSLLAPDDAMQAAENYFPDDEEIKKKITEVRGLCLKAEERAQKEKNDAQYVADVNRSIKLWQQKETGAIDEAAYYVLRQQYPADNFGGEGETKSQTPLSDVYRLLKEKNSDERLNGHEMRKVGNSLISAYKQHKIGLTEAIDWQNQMIDATGFEKPVFDAVDNIFGADTTEHTVDADNFMENKAKRAMEFYQSYAAEKEKRVAEFGAEGGVLTPAVERKLCLDALNKAKENLGFKDGEKVSFDEINQAMQAVYYGNRTDEIWQRFYQEMPYAEDKVAVMRRLAATAQRKELMLPRFDNYEEVLKAHLNSGDKFYFRGRLAMWS
jgi:hypothetical protein